LKKRTPLAEMGKNWQQQKYRHEKKNLVQDFIIDTTFR
jgi:hypothetical protein